MITATNEVFQALGNFGNCESASLRLNKFLDNAKATRGHYVHDFVAKANSQFAKFYGEPYQFVPQLPNGRAFAMTLGAKLLLNQSGGVFENTGVSIHPFFGGPTIPGSALKGIASHAAFQEWQETDEGAKDDLAKRVIRVFGYPTGHEALDQYVQAELPEEAEIVAGQVCFLPAVGKIKNNGAWTEDICTTHHPEYYQGKRQLAIDNEAPIPLPFPAVDAGTTFFFPLVPRRNCTVGTLDDAQNWLIRALAVNGAGAKTAAGYGWFEPFETGKSAKILSEYRQNSQLAKWEAARKALEEQAKEEQRIKKLQEEKKRWESMSPEERAQEDVAALRDDQFKTLLRNFPKQDKNAIPDEKKKILVRCLKGSKVNIWNEIRQQTKENKKAGWPAIVQCIFKFNKDMNEGGMPQ